MNESGQCVHGLETVDARFKPRLGAMSGRGGGAERRFKGPCRLPAPRRSSRRRGDAGMRAHKLRSRRAHQEAPVQCWSCTDGADRDRADPTYFDSHRYRPTDPSLDGWRNATSHGPALAADVEPGRWPGFRRPNVLGPERHRPAFVRDGDPERCSLGAPAVERRPRPHTFGRPRPLHASEPRTFRRP